MPKREVYKAKIKEENKPTEPLFEEESINADEAMNTIYTQESVQNTVNSNDFKSLTGKIIIEMKQLRQTFSEHKEEVAQ